MPEFKIIKTLIRNGKTFKYEVIADNQKVAQRISARDYVACLVQENDPTTTAFIKRGKYHALTWFGRPDLIGKGSSRYWINKPGIFIAYLQQP